MKVTTALSKFVKRSALALPLVAAPAISVQVLDALGFNANGFGQAYAQEEKKPSKVKTRKTPSISEAVGKKLGQAQELADAQQFNEALAVLREMEARSSKYSAYERAQVAYFMAYIYFSLENYDAAIASYKKVLSVPSENLTEALEIGSLQAVSQLSFVKEDYKGALRYINRWMDVSQIVTGEMYYLRAQAHYQLKDNANALKDISKAVSMVEGNGKVPKQAWYDLQRFLYYDKNDYPSVVKVLEKLVKHYPQGTYYIQLAGMYGQLGREKDQLHMMEAAYIAGVLKKEKELLNMAYLFMGAEMPYKGAKVIKKGIDNKQIERTSKNLETLAVAYQMAQELKKSIPEMEAAASMSDKGELYSRLAGIYLDLDQNKEAITAGDKALKKGGLKREDQLRIVLGMANANLKKYEAALKHLEVAKKDKRSKKFAEQWIAYVEGEKKREEQLAI